MMTTMRPIMRPCSGTSLLADDDLPGVPVSTSPQVGGFIIWRCGAHDDGTTSIGVSEPPMDRNTALRLLESRSSSPRTPARDTDGRITGPSWPDLNPTILADHQTDGSGRSLTRGRVNVLLRPFIIRVMRQMMRQMMRPGPGSQNGPAAAADGAPESTSSQLEGLITSVPGVHDCRTRPSIRCPSSPSARTISLCSICCLTPTRTIDRPAKGCTLVFVVIDDDIRPGHSANEPTTSPAPASSFGSTVTSSRRCRTERGGTTANPGGLRVQEAPGTPITLTMRVHDRGSKIDNQHG
jgi:hypothetical protein